MKTVLFVFLAIIYGTSTSFSQDAETRFFEKNKHLGGEVEIKSAKIEVIGNDVFKTFEVHSPMNGQFYFDAWINVPKKENKLPEYRIITNGVESQATLKPYKEGWQSAAITNKKGSATTIKLKSGINKISVVTKSPESPNVEFVKLSSSPTKAGISDVKYNQYFEKVKTESTSADRIASSSLISKASSPDTTAASLKSFGTMSTKGTNGEEFSYSLNIPIMYTTYLRFNFTAGQSVSLQTANLNGFQYVIELFSESNPSTYSWSSWASGNGNLNVTIPSGAGGGYYVRLRTYKQGWSGLVSLNINNGQYIYSNCLVAGFGIAQSGSLLSPNPFLNYFTCKLSGGDTRLWLEDNTGIPGKIRAFNDDYSTQGDFYWGFASRIKYNTTNIGAGLVSAYSSNQPDATCDLYLGLVNSDIMPYFPSLRSDDAIRTAPASSVYNCISWSGGITNDWEWPEDPFSEYNIPGNPLASFDYFYDVCGYTRTGATASNAGVALWATSYEFTHASITKNSITKYAHGYDWESKPGALARTMHPRDALGGKSYGSIVHYYTPKPNMARAFSNPELIIPDEESFNSMEISEIENLKGQISASVRNEFESKYDNWVKTRTDVKIAMHSNPRKYAESKEYKELVSFCKKQGKSTWPLFIEKLAEGDIFTINLLEDLTLSENKELLDEVKNSTKLKSFGANQLLPSLNSNAVNYAKKLLVKQQPNILKSINSNSTNLKASTLDEKTNIDLTVSTNNSEIMLQFTLSNKSNVSVKVYDIYGMIAINDGTRHDLNVGNHTIVLNSLHLRNGVYVVNVTVGNETFSEKVTINR